MQRMDRRKLMLGVGVVGLAAPALVRAQSFGFTRPTAFQPEGPFYPYEDKPSDQDADLVRVTGSDALALGQVAHVTGRPAAGALVEIWQCDHTGRYIHRDDPNVDRPRDGGFQGYGKALTDDRGAFRFRTIKPVAYTAKLGSGQIWRAPHIHVAVSTRGVRRLTSQLYVAGDPRNEADLLLHPFTTPEQREAIVRPYETAESIEPGALQAHYDLVILE
jgi:protocatechuate 3,4-dioxygenase, beta subunit